MVKASRFYDEACSSGMEPRKRVNPSKDLGWYCRESRFGRVKKLRRGCCSCKLT